MKKLKIDNLDLKILIKALNELRSRCLEKGDPIEDVNELLIKCIGELKK